MAADTIEESNLAGIGSDMDKALRKAAAESEEEFAGAGAEVGLEIWRIEKFEPVKIRDEKEHGVFYMGDAYIILNTYTDPGTDSLKWDLHFWLGRDSTQDEQGSAAYLTVNLDDLLNGAPVQHREVQAAESKMFMSYFKEIMLVEGGVDSGFTSPEPEVYESKLFHVYGKGSDVRVAQVPLEVGSLNRSDVFILDLGMKVYQWNSTDCGPFERMRGSNVLEKIVSMRNSEPEGINIDGEEVFELAEFWEPFGVDPPSPDDIPETPPVEEPEDPAERKMYKMSDEDGSLDIEEVQVVEDGPLDSSLLEEDEVMVITAHNKMYFYVGKTASRNERFTMIYKTSDVLDKCGLPVQTEVIQVKKGQTTPEFDELF